MQHTRLARFQQEKQTLEEKHPDIFQECESPSQARLLESLVILISDLKNELQSHSKESQFLNRVGRHMIRPLPMRTLWKVNSSGQRGRAISLPSDQCLKSNNQFLPLINNTLQPVEIIQTQVQQTLENKTSLILDCIKSGSEKLSEFEFYWDMSTEGAESLLRLISQPHTVLIEQCGQRYQISSKVIAQVKLPHRYQKNLHSVKSMLLLREYLSFPFQFGFFKLTELPFEIKEGGFSIVITGDCGVEKMAQVSAKTNVIAIENGVIDTEVFPMQASSVVSIKDSPERQFVDMVSVSLDVTDQEKSSELYDGFYQYYDTEHESWQCVLANLDGTRQALSIKALWCEKGASSVKLGDSVVSSEGDLTGEVACAISQMKPHVLSRHYSQLADLFMNVSGSVWVDTHTVTQRIRMAFALYTSDLPCPIKSIKKKHVYDIQQGAVHSVWHYHVELLCVSWPKHYRLAHFGLVLHHYFCLQQPLLGKVKTSICYGSSDRMDVWQS